MANELELFWLDRITQLWEKITVPGVNKSVKSYRVTEKREFPETIEEFPAALSYITGAANIEYSLGGGISLMWEGVTEFHIVKGVDKKQIPFCMRFPKRIVAQAASSLTLGGQVDNFELVERNGYFIQGPLPISYGDEMANYGFFVNWRVAETLTGEITVSA